MVGRPGCATQIVPADELLTSDQIEQERWTSSTLEQAIADTTECIKWLVRRQLLVNSVLCTRCGRPARLNNNRTKGRCPDGKEWRCRRCAFRCSVRAGSFFQGSHLTLQQVVRILYMCSINMPLHIIQRETGLSATTVIEWTNFCRDGRRNWIRQHPIEIDEQGQSVVDEKDESLDSGSRDTDMEDSVDTGEPSQSQDQLLPVHSKRKRSTSKGETSTDAISQKKPRCRQSSRKESLSDAVTATESSFVSNLKTCEPATDGSNEIKTSTPNPAGSVSRRRKTRSMTETDASASISVSQLEVTDKGQTEDVIAEQSSVADDSKPLERSGRRNKCTSARVLLGLGRRKGKEANEKVKDSNERVGDGTSTDQKMSAASSKVKQVVVDQSQHVALTAALQAISEMPSVERCSTVNPEWLKPFKLGWRREIVFRNTVKVPSSSKPACDVYYFSADDTKLRSLPQILEYLKTTKSTLTGSCFTFTKYSIFKEPQEIVRSAAFSRGKVSRKTSVVNSNESSMKSFDDTNDDVISLASSQGSARRYMQSKKRLKELTINVDELLKNEDLVKKEVPVVPEKCSTSPILPMVPDVLVKTEDKKKEDVSLEAGLASLTDETDKRQAVRAAATMALRTYMCHALRAVNNPLLQSGMTKTPDKPKPVTDKSKSVSPASVSKVKGPPVKRRHQAMSRSPCTKASEKKADVVPVVALTKLDERKLSKAGAINRPPKPSPLNSKEERMRHRKLKARQDFADEKPALPTKKVSILKRSLVKMPPASSIAVPERSESITVKKDCGVSMKKYAKGHQETTISTKMLTKSKTITVMPQAAVKILPKSDSKSNEKPMVVSDRRPSTAAITSKPAESSQNTTYRLCGMDCPGRLGIPPSMHCATCMCLFHPECAGFASYMSFAPRMDFTCSACQNLSKELETTAYGLNRHKTPEKLPGEISQNSVNEKNQTSSTKACGIMSSSIPGGGIETKATAVALLSPMPLQILDGSSVQEHSSTVPSSWIDPLISSATTGVETVSTTQPTAQLLVMPLGIARHLNLSMPLILLVDDMELNIKPEQMKVSSGGVNVRLPIGMLPDSYISGREKPLEFRVVSSALSGVQAVSVCSYVWPPKPPVMLKNHCPSQKNNVEGETKEEAGQREANATISESCLASVKCDAGNGQVVLSDGENVVDAGTEDVVSGKSGITEVEVKCEGLVLPANEVEDKTENICAAMEALDLETPKNEASTLNELDSRAMPETSDSMTCESGTNTNVESCGTAVLNDVEAETSYKVAQTGIMDASDLGTEASVGREVDRVMEDVHCESKATIPSTSEISTTVEHEHGAETTEHEEHMVMVGNVDTEVGDSSEEKTKIPNLSETTAEMDMNKDVTCSDPTMQ